MLISKTSASTAYVAEVRAHLGVDAGIVRRGRSHLQGRCERRRRRPGRRRPDLRRALRSEQPRRPERSEVRGARRTPVRARARASAAGPVTVQVLSGTPATGFQVRMTGPANARQIRDPATQDPDLDRPTRPDRRTPTTKTGGIEPKLRLDGKKRVTAALTCPTGASACTGTVTLALPDGKKLATRRLLSGSARRRRPAQPRSQGAQGAEEGVRQEGQDQGNRGPRRGRRQVTQKVKLLR